MMKFLAILFATATLVIAKEDKPSAGKRDSRQINLNLHHPRLLAASPIPFQADVRLGHHHGAIPLATGNVQIGHQGLLPAGHVQVGHSGLLPGNVDFKAGTYAHADAESHANSGPSLITGNVFGPTINAANPQPNPEQQAIEEEWSEFQSTYKKTYVTAEIASYRREVFIENRAKIAKHNREYSRGLKTFVQQMNPFGDLLFNEFNQLLNGLNRSTVAKPKIPVATTFIPSANVNIPHSVDWRQVGAVTPVKNQGSCAGCWAFAAAGALEGQWFRRTSNLVDVSEQDLLDCTINDKDGCSGGLITPAFQYVRKNNGVDVEEQYPTGYEATDKNGCRHNREGLVKCTGYVDIAENDEKGLELAVATIGPVAVGIEVQPDFQFHANGVYFNPACGHNGDKVNHAVLVVGYGQETNGQNYWLVKNSYGTEWGVGGYVKMAKDANNHCGIASLASYPLV